MRYLLILATALLAVGCKAKPAADAGFIQNPDQMSDDLSDRTPFQRGWVSEKWKNEKQNYKKLIVAPVNTDYVAKSSWWNKQTTKTKAKLEQGRQNMAIYMHEQVTDAFLHDPNKRFEIVYEASPNTAVLEIALVELVPSKVFFNAAGTLTTFFVPGTMMVTRSTGKGSVAFEARVIDSQTGEVLVKFADREKDKTALINPAQYAWYQHSKRNIKDWAKQFVKVANSPGERVKDTSAFTLRPW